MRPHSANYPKAFTATNVKQMHNIMAIYSHANDALLMSKVNSTNSANGWKRNAPKEVIFLDINLPLTSRIKCTT